MTKATDQVGQADPQADPLPPDQVDQPARADVDQQRTDQLDAREQHLAEREAAMSRREQSQTSAGRQQLAEQDARPADDGRRRYTLTLQDGSEVQSDTGESFTLVLANGTSVHAETLISTGHASEAGGQSVPVVAAYPDEIKSRRDNTA